MAKHRAGQGKRKSFRLRFNFWLNMEKPDEEAIADKIEVLKNERSFSSVIRDGIRLICDLREGKLDVLFSMFPWVRVEFMEYMRELTAQAVPEQGSIQQMPETSHTDADRAWLEAEQERIEQEREWQERRLEEAQRALEAERRAIEQERQRIEAERSASQSAIQQQLDRLEQLLLQQGHVPIESPSEPVASRGEQPPSHSGPKQLSVPKFSAPQYDDEEEEDLLEVKKDESAGMRATQNFLNSLMSLNSEPGKPPNTRGKPTTLRQKGRELGQ